MVFRTFARFSRSCSRSCSKSYSHPFFNPSYRNPNEVTRLEEVGYQKGTGKTNNSGYSSTVMPVVTVTRNYVIFDPQHRKRRAQEERLVAMEQQKVMLKRVSHMRGNKKSGGHLRINVESINGSQATLNVRRANSSQVKTFVLPMEMQQQQQQQQQAQTYATAVPDTSINPEEIEKQLKKLSLEEAKPQETVEQVEELQESDVTPEVSSPKTFVASAEGSAPFTAEDLPLQRDHSVKFEESSISPDEPLSLSEERVIDSMMSMGKHNEVLALYYRMRSNNEVPSIEIYNKILKSVQMRETDETCEQKLTHLLNVYSDMLSNNLKPNDKTYELVIEPLLKGSLKSYRQAHFKEGADFLKIAMELFLISHKSNGDIRFKNASIYTELLSCLNSYQMLDTPTELLYDLMRDRIPGSTAKTEFYLQMIRLASLKRDTATVEKMYGELQQLHAATLQKNQYRIYSSLIEALNFCGETERSKAMLDKVVSEMEDKTSPIAQKNIQQVLSSFLKSQGWMDPVRAYETLIQFNSIAWLPDVSISALCNLFACFLHNDNLEMARKVWDYTVIRDDFDAGIREMTQQTEENYMAVNQSLDRYVEMLLAQDDKNGILKTVREVLVKESLVLSDRALVDLLTYLQSKEYYELSTKLTIDQGYKQGTKEQATLNNYLSLVVDFLSAPQLEQIASSRFFKKTVEDYRLVKDNVYGLIKVFNELLSNLSNDQKRQKLAYYTKVLTYELDDVANFYVDLPEDLKSFKVQLFQLERKLALN